MTSRRQGGVRAATSLTVLAAASLVALTSCTSVGATSHQASPTAQTHEATSPTTIAKFGEVSGLLPLCYGPGADTDLKPVVLVIARGESGQDYRQRFPSSNTQRTYEMELPPGEYTLSSYAGDVAVTVMAGRTTTVNMPQPACL